MTQPIPVPSTTEVTKAHSNADTDASQNALHHTLGQGHNQSSPGDHNHNGKNSKKIGKGINAAFPTTANAAYTQSQIQTIIDALRSIGFGS